MHNTGGVFMITIFSAIVLLPVHRSGHRHTLPNTTRSARSVPELSLYNLNILGKLGFGALGGFEYMAILAGETQRAVAIGRAIGVYRGAGHRIDVRAGHEHAWSPTSRTRTSI